MHIIYIDDSADEKLCVFSALAVQDDCWNEAFEQVRAYRRHLQESEGISIHKEFHAWKFVSGRGRLAERDIPKARRCAIFKEVLRFLAGLRGVHLFNTVAPAKRKPAAYERLLTHINECLRKWESYAILVIDQGAEAEYLRLTRRIRTYNPSVQDTTLCADTRIERILEDPFFKDSQHSYWIQMTDFCGYALLRYERPLESKMKYGLHEAFPLLEPIFVKEANPKDPYGIIRLE
ncbi:MAG: DUF3800 domain-containing protein [Fimbriimonadales bacterium]|nr:DUF3800 domain-containing protein [Fimbriimonadales bacterium]